MTAGILIGAGGMLALAVIISLFDGESRDVWARVVLTLVLTPLIPIYALLRRVVDNDKFQARLVSKATLRRFVLSNEYSGVVVHYRGRGHIVVTDPKVWQRNRH